MALLPIYYGSREASLKAAMVFPREPEKALVFAAWLLVKAYGHMVAAGMQSSGVPSPDITCAAADFAYLHDEALRNLRDGVVAGIITAVLDSLICENIEIASWKTAIELSEKYVTSYNEQWRKRASVRRKAHFKSNRSQYTECLAKFAPALHLLGARIMRRQDDDAGGGFKRIIDLRSDASANYRRHDDLLFFVAEAKQLQLLLYWWDRGWDRKRSPRSENLREMFEFDGTWMPPPRQLGWPDGAGKLKRLLLEPDMKPVHKKVGRPAKPRSE